VQLSIVENLRGVIPPVATPLTEERKVDEPGLRRLVRHVLDGGACALFVMGSTGEFSAFTREVRRSIIEMVIDEVAGRVPILAGVSDSGSELAALNAKDAEAAGADAVVLTMPYYFPASTDRDALDHFRCVAGSTGLPLIMYNVPRAVKSAIGVDSVVQLAEEGTVVAIKDSSTDFTHFQQLILSLSHLPHFRIFQGSEFQMGASVLMGAHGGVLGISNVAPRLCVQLYEAASSGNIDLTRELQRKVTAVSQVFWAGESTLGGLKAAISMLGICGPTPTMPIQPVSAEPRKKIRKILEDCGLIPG